MASVTQRAVLRDISEYSNDSTRDTQDINLTCAIFFADRAFNLPVKVKMLHLNDVFKQELDIWNKSPGLPWCNQGYKTFGDIKKDPDAIQRIRKFWHIVKTGCHMKAPACLIKKVAAAWEYPATITFGEAVFSLPLIRAYQTRTGPIAEGYKTDLGGMEKIYERFGRGKFYCSLDFKCFDKTVPAWLIDVAFKILLLNIDQVHYEDYGVADARCMIFMYAYLEDYFINTTIQTANGCRYQKNTGIASGSYFTQLIRSVVNYILCQWIHITQFGCSADDILVLGDDTLMSTKQLLDLAAANTLMNSIGMELNREKSKNSNNLQSLNFGSGIPFKKGSP